MSAVESSRAAVREEARAHEEARVATPRGTVLILGLYMATIVLFWAYAYLTMLMRR